MTIRKIYRGTQGPDIYDDSLLINDPEGLFSGQTLKALATDGDVLIGGIVSSGGIIYEITEIDDSVGDYTLTESDGLVFVDALSGAIKITLPSAVGISGKGYTIKKVDTSRNRVNIAAYGSETIEGVSSQYLSRYGDSIDLVSDGDEWFIL